MPYLLVFFTFVLGLFTSLVLIAPISRLAVSIGILDQADGRKIHTGRIPRLGGIAIFFSVLLATILFSDVDQVMKAYLAGGIIIFLTGLSDDLQELSPRQKFLGELVAATVAIVIGGQALPSLGNLLGFGELSLGIFSLPFTIIALVGVINAVNLIDGLDGLAGGVTAIAVLGFLILAGLAGNSNLMYIAATLFGATLGFLKFNTHPAQIFMGDSGSLFLGYSLGFCAINLAVEGGGSVSPVTPLMVLALPIVDTIVVMAGRIRRGTRFSAPDNTHLHHRLLTLGFSHGVVVALLYSVSYCFALAAVIFRAAPDYLLFYALLAVLLLGYLNLLLMEREQARRGALKIFDLRLPYLKLYHNPRLLQMYTGLLRGSKYLLVAVFGLTMFIPPVIRGDIGIVAALLVALFVVMLSVRTDHKNRFLHFAIYFNGAFVIYLMQNYTGEVGLFGTPLYTISNVVFGLLFLVILVLAAIRANPTAVISTPLEYLIIFLVISVPLLPDQFQQQHHLLLVAGKSVILFVALKLVLKPWVHRNRKIILAALVSLLVIALRNLFSL
jgi:UDP-GlcNAc:undecaprenyl-phosphate/decaprenyl-phosphate GlcNAc-1-phosphate transferase